MPNALLYKFEGNFFLPDGNVVPMGPDEILLRGSSLKNTEWVYGVCVFTGHETKIMKNGTKSRPKKNWFLQRCDKSGTFYLLQLHVT